nr:hypothetical protein [Halomonas sp. HL-48]
MVYKNAIFIIDVRSHKEESVFSDLQLMESLESSWPEIMSNYEIKGLKFSNVKTSKKDISKNRRVGLLTSITINGKLYFPPGQGVTAASTPGVVTDVELRLIRSISWIGDLICSDENPLRKEMEKLNIKIHDIELRLSPKGLIIYSKKADCGWLLKGHPESVFSFVREMMTPDWVVSQLQDRIEKPLLALTY